MWGISRRAVAIRERLFVCAYMLPIRDLCATAFCVLLSGVFLRKKKLQLSRAIPLPNRAFIFLAFPAHGDPLRLDAIAVFCPFIGIITGKYEMMARKRKKSRCSNDGGFRLRGRRFWRDENDGDSVLMTESWQVSRSMCWARHCAAWLSGWLSKTAVHGGGEREQRRLGVVDDLDLWLPSPSASTVTTKRTAVPCRRR